MHPPVFYDIKKQNGESFAQTISKYDNGIFDVPHLASIVKYAGRDATPILDWLEGLKKVKIRPRTKHENPIDLLDKAGYNAYVADTLEKQNAIRKYFDKKEELCTFDDKKRYKEYYIINAVRKDVDDIKRSPTPERQDKYGTSVISIQVLKRGGFITIKNRYNHTVECPDNTFGSKPDRIIEGLADAIKNYFGVDFSTSCGLVPNHYVVFGDQICKYNIENRGVYYGKDFYINGEVHKLVSNIEWMIHPGLIFNSTTKKVCSDYKEVDWLQKFIENRIDGKPLQITKNVYGGYNLVAAGHPFLSFKDGMITWIDAPVAPQTALYNEYGISNTRFMCDELDLRGMPSFYLEDVDVSDVKNLMFNSSAKRVYLYNVKGLHGTLDLSDVREIYISETDLSDVNLKLNPFAHAIDLTYVSGMTGNHDLSHVKSFDGVGLDCEKATLKLNPDGIVRGISPYNPAYKAWFTARQNTPPANIQGRVH